MQNRHNSTFKGGNFQNVITPEHNDFRSAGCLPFYKTSVAPTAIQALSENFIPYKDRLQFQLKEIEDDLVTS